MPSVFDEFSNPLPLFWYQITLAHGSHSLPALPVRLYDTAVQSFPIKFWVNQSFHRDSLSQSHAHLSVLDQSAFAWFQYLF